MFGPSAAPSSRRPLRRPSLKDRRSRADETHGGVPRRHPRPFHLVISLSTFLNTEVCAAVVLALWALVRFPSLGPRSLPGALGVLVATLGVSHVVPSAVGVVLRLPQGLYLVLLCVTLPMLFVLFLAGGWFVRALLALRGGSGGPGHQIPLTHQS